MRVFLSLALLLTASLFAQNQPDWVKKSDANARLLIDIQAKYEPESAGFAGVRGVDEQISDLNSGAKERDAIREARAELQSRLTRETDPLVKQDLQILIDAADQQVRQSEATEKYFIPWADAGGLVFGGVQGLLDDQIAPERRAAALVRLKKYTGLEPGFKPLTTVAEERFREKENQSGLLGPSKEEVEKALENSKTYVNGIGLLFEKYKIRDYAPAYAKLKEQLADYEAFLRKEVVPKERSSFRLPPEFYEIQLKGYGVDYPSAELARLAHASFTDIQAQMQVLAAKIAKQRGLPSSDYRDVIAALKKDQIPADQVLSHYEKRLAEIEDVIRANHLVTLPQRKALIRIATAAETAQQPAPHLQPAPLLNNHGERSVFVLPLETTGKGGDAMKYDDFSYAAVSWTLTAHEARPGHELQFDGMIEHGVSQARGIFAFNSTNVEGWGLYAEWFMLPYMPDDAKLVSLDFRLLRAARAFLDPELQQGKVTPEQAMQVLQKDVVCSKAFATEELERFTFGAPGQAVSYFDGLTRLLEIRQAAEKALGPKFNAQKFHDFILSQGLLPPDLLRKAVMEDFVRAS
jgi:hypothetical protein